MMEDAFEKADYFTVYDDDYALEHESVGEAIRNAHLDADPDVPMPHRITVKAFRRLTCHDRNAWIERRAESLAESWFDTFLVNTEGHPYDHNQEAAIRVLQDECTVALTDIFGDKPMHLCKPVGERSYTRAEVLEMLGRTNG